MYLLLSDYETVENFSEESFKKIVQSKYGLDCSEFLENTKKVVTNESGKDLILADQFFLRCLSIEAKKIDSKDKTIEFFDKYRYYKNQFQTTCDNENGFDVIVIAQDDISTLSPFFNTRLSPSNSKSSLISSFI